MKLKRLVRDIPVQQIKGPKEVEITGICSNSKRVAPGNLFVARRGKVDDGTKYIPEAIAAGAVAILTDIYDPSLKITQLIDPGVEKVEALLAASYYQNPSGQLFMAGITGTNGKTTTAFLARSLLETPDSPCGLIGTIEYIIGHLHYQATRTTPDVCSNHKMLREMVNHECKSAVMEVTSHALDQGRVDEINFDAAVFTNLTQDHLDYHLTMEQYAKAKQRLFLSLDPQKNKHSNVYRKVAVVNGDDPWHLLMVQGCKGQVLKYGLEEPHQLHAKSIDVEPLGTSFTLVYEGKEFPVTTPLSGKHNVYNILGAVGIALSAQIPLESIIERIKTAPPVPGRLQRIANPLGLTIFVDFAHTDAALLNVISCLKEIKKRSIITVFGCGGDRDSSKRSKMGAVCGAYSDYSIVTTDNPRSEDPEGIIREILQGFQYGQKYEVQVDRYHAIKRAIEMADKEDIILIAGRGHDSRQIFAHKTIEFDDAKVAASICEEYAYVR